MRRVAVVALVVAVVACGGSSDPSSKPLARAGSPAAVGTPSPSSSPTASGAPTAGPGSTAPPPGASEPPLGTGPAPPPPPTPAPTAPPTSGPPPPPTPTPTPVPQYSCGNGDPFAHVYTPSRLTVLDSCVTVAGIVDGSHSEADGDVHVLLRLDPGSTCAGQTCTNVANNQHTLGDLIVEIICQHSTTDPTAASACSGYTNTLPVPQAGSHILVTGPWVNDTAWGWNEIHPIIRIGS